MVVFLWVVALVTFVSSDFITLPTCGAGCTYVHYFWAGDPTTEAYQGAATDLPILLSRNVDLTTHKLIFWHQAGATFDFATALGNDITVVAITDPRDIVQGTSELGRNRLFSSKALKYWNRFTGYKKYALVKDFAMLLILYAHGGYFLDTTTGPVLPLTCTGCSNECVPKSPINNYWVYGATGPGGDGAVDVTETLSHWECEPGASSSADCSSCGVQETTLAQGSKISFTDPPASGDVVVVANAGGSWSKCVTDDYSPRGTVRFSDEATDCRRNAAPKTLGPKDFYYMWANPGAEIVSNIAKSFLYRMRRMKSSVRLRTIFLSLATKPAGTVTLGDAFTGAYKDSTSLDDNAKATVAQAVEQILPSISSSAFFDGLDGATISTDYSNFPTSTRDVSKPNFRGWNAQCIGAQNGAQLCKRMTGGWRGTVNFLEMAELLNTPDIDIAHEEASPNALQPDFGPW